MDLVTLNLYQFASFGQFPSKLRFYHQNLPGYLNISNVVSFWDTLIHMGKRLFSVVLSGMESLQKRYYELTV